MRPETHAGLMDQYHKSIFLIVPVLFFLAFSSTCSADEKTIIRNFIIFLLLMALYILIELFIMELPVQCNAPGCKGWMEKNITRQISKSEAIINYHCKSCDSICDEIIFNLESGGYDYIP